MTSQGGLKIVIFGIFKTSKNGIFGNFDDFPIPLLIVIFTHLPHKTSRFQVWASGPQVRFFGQNHDFDDRRIPIA